MTLSRRTFLQSTLSAGLGVAAEATGSRWLLRSGSILRIGIAGLGATASDHLAVFAAIPGAEIVGVADPNEKNLYAASTYLVGNGQNPPCLYRNCGDLLNHSSLHALAIPSCTLNGAQMMLDAIAEGIPVLLDAPAILTQREHGQMLRVLQATRTPVHFRLADYLYPSSVTDVRSWLARSGSTGTEVRLALPAFAAPNLRIPVIVALEAVLDTCAPTDEHLLLWGAELPPSSGMESKGMSYSLALPSNPLSFEHLLVHCLPRMLAPISTLHLRSPRGAVDVGISGQADGLSSLHTAMVFLTSVRDGAPANAKRSCRAQAAAAGADQVLMNLNASISRVHSGRNVIDIPSKL